MPVGRLFPCSDCRRLLRADITLNENGTYDVPLACAQEGCGPRQMGSLGKFAQYNPTVDLAFAEWTMRTAAAWAKLLGVDDAMQVSRPRTIIAGIWAAFSEDFKALSDNREGRRTS